jgi:hypothetical protein
VSLYFFWVDETGTWGGNYGCFAPSIGLNFSIIGLRHNFVINESHKRTLHAGEGGAAENRIF